MAASDYYRRPLLERLLIKFSIKYANENILVSRNEYEQIYKDWNLKNIVYSPHCIDTVKYSRECIAIEEMNCLLFVGQEKKM